MQDITSKKLISKRKGKEKATSASSAIDRPQFLDDIVVNNLGEMSAYLYEMLMNQFEDEPLQIEFEADVFLHRGKVHLAIEDVMKLFTNDMLNVSILQIFCM
jgi:hypothetical protein